MNAKAHPRVKLSRDPARQERITDEINREVDPGTTGYTS
jgi:hypothetical protein